MAATMIIHEHMIICVYILVLILVDLMAAGFLAFRLSDIPRVTGLDMERDSVCKGEGGGELEDGGREGVGERVMEV